ncbi:MAG TPA: NAD-dependent epimerase/dehydratase family protein [Myxococcaceae bacterium]|nr:NAD-dependent epimerase/dehydratase family protein [Myxococcaceae bacterium]
MRTLLTGATGLIGANLVRTLLRAGERPRVLLTPGSDARPLAGLDVERVSGDVRDAHSLARAMKGVQRVFHAAGHVRFDDAGRLLLWTINVEGTRQVLQAARSAGVRRLVHVSSSVAVGHGTLDRPATEEGPPPERSTPYAESKRAAEEVALGDWGEVQVVVCNPTFVVGPYGTGATSAEVVRLVASGVVLAYPPGGANFVNADDVASGLALAMRTGQPRTRYILGGENLTHREFLAQVAEECGQRPPAVALPGWAARALGRTGDVLGALSSARLGWVNTPFLRQLFEPAYVSSARAERTLGYRPRPVRHGIRDALRWYQEEQLLPRDRPLTPRGVLIRS